MEGGGLDTTRWGRWVTGCCWGRASRSTGLVNLDEWRVNGAVAGAGLAEINVISR